MVTHIKNMYWNHDNRKISLSLKLCTSVYYKNILKITSGFFGIIIYFLSLKYYLLEIFLTCHHNIKLKKNLFEVFYDTVTCL